MAGQKEGAMCLSSVLVLSKEVFVDKYSEERRKEGRFLFDGLPVW